MVSPKPSRNDGPNANKGSQGAPHKRDEVVASQGTAMSVGADAAKIPDSDAPDLLGAAPSRPESSRKYAQFPDFTKKPMAFIAQENAPWPDCVTLRNGLWIHKDKYMQPQWRFSVMESGADPSGCAKSHSFHRTLKEAILAAVERKPFEHPAEKAKRVEAQARAGNDPEMALYVEDLLDKCSNMLGKLDEGVRYRIRSYMVEPSLDGWEDVHGIMLRGRGRTTTIWQHWLGVNSQAPKHGPGENIKGERLDEWDLIPTPAEIMVILREAAHREDETNRNARG